MNSFYMQTANKAKRESNKQSILHNIINSIIKNYINQFKQSNSIMHVYSEVMKKEVIGKK